jgi:iron complex transport system ATP-binding protein
MKEPASISIENASWSEPHNRKVILHPISFELMPGRILGIVGPNGSGKSTLLRLLYRYLKPTTGIVRVDGIDIWGMPARQVACKVAAVLQEHPSDFSFTVKEIVGLGRTPHRKWFGSANGVRDNEIISFALRLLNLYDLADRELSTLSGGERQRVMVARALAQEPNILILDEPTNHLDIRQQLETIKLLKDLQITIVTSLHDLNMAASTCDDVLLVKDGRSLGFGQPDNIFSEKKITQAFQVTTKHEVLTPSKEKHITFHL